jgi:hypothetical protein
MTLLAGCKEDRGIAGLRCRQISVGRLCRGLLFAVETASVRGCEESLVIWMGDSRAD